MKKRCDACKMYHEESRPCQSKSEKKNLIFATIDLYQRLSPMEALVTITDGKKCSRCNKYMQDPHKCGNIARESLMITRNVVVSEPIDEYMTIYRVLRDGQMTSAGVDKSKVKNYTIVSVQITKNKLGI